MQIRVMGIINLKLFIDTVSLVGCPSKICYYPVFCIAVLE